MRELIYFILSLTSSCVLTALAVLIGRTSPIWAKILWYGTGLFAIFAVALLVHALMHYYQKKDASANPLQPRKITAAPEIKILFDKSEPYEVSDIQHGHVLSTIRIGIKNSGSVSVSNCKVFVEKISPEPPLPGGLPILLDGSGFIVRHDDPVKLIDVATHWDHVDKFRFNAPYTGGFAETLGYIQDDTPRTIVIKIVTTECHRSASFKIWTDDQRALHLEFLSYVG